MKISFNTPNPAINKPEKSRLKFQGYAACPLKALYLQPDRSLGNLFVAKELKKIGDKEGFGVFVQIKDKIFSQIHKIPVLYDEISDAASSRWGQDNKVFLKKGKIEQIAGNGVILEGEEDIIYQLATAINIRPKIMRSSLDGGNFFIGKKDNGEMYALVGIDSISETAQKLAWEDKGKIWQYKRRFYQLDQIDELREYFHKNEEEYLIKAKAQIARDLKLKPDQINIVSQPEFHLDMAIRPLQYPYILVNDSNIFIDQVNMIYNNPNCKNKDKHLLKDLNKFFTANKEKNAGAGYITPDETRKELEKLGFEVIKVPGIIPARTNFMNAIVHQRPNGDLVYITNKTDFDDYGMDFNKLFKDFIFENVPFIKDIQFIAGGRQKYADNFISNSLEALSGGIHCMVAERPDFDRWA